jgi:hypothetical protein
MLAIRKAVEEQSPTRTHLSFNLSHLLPAFDFGLTRFLPTTFTLHLSPSFAPVIEDYPSRP